jgi:hypothetical protein
MELFPTTLDLYGGVLRSGELQGFIIHETMPTRVSPCVRKLGMGLTSVLLISPHLHSLRAYVLNPRL